MNKQFDIVAAAPVEWIEAADGEQKLPTFQMMAYTGGAMRVGGFSRPVVVDLSGAQISGEDLPMYRDHDPSKIIGHGKVTVSDGDIQANGLVSADNEHSRDVVTSSKNGFPWQASIGASVQEMETIKAGESVVVNGQTIPGPVLVARRTTLNEISFVPRGADPRTSATVAAQATDSQERVTLAELHSRRTK